MTKPSPVRWLYDNLEELLAVACVGAMVACLSIQVGVRWITGSGLAWSEELSRVTFLWTVFCAAPLVAKQCAHVRITAQFLILPPKYRLVVRAFTDALWIVCNLLIAWWCSEVIKGGLEYPELSPTLHIVRSYVEMIIPASFVLMSWRIAEGYVVRWRQGTLLELVLEEYETLKQ
jgi:TRAP-type C4-dicarboxylate transport system permease small subunit